MHSNTRPNKCRFSEELLGVLETAFKKVQWIFKREGVLRRIVRSSSKKRLLRRHLEAETRLFGVRPSLRAPYSWGFGVEKWEGLSTWLNFSCLRPRKHSMKIPRKGKFGALFVATFGEM